MALINPVVLHCARLVANGFDPKHKESLYNGIAQQRVVISKTAGSDISALKRAYIEWHRNPPQAFKIAEGPASSALTGELGSLKLIDLGCGEAYRSRWLARLGVKDYLGLDGSPKLIETAIARRNQLERRVRDLAAHHRYVSVDLETHLAQVETLASNFVPNLACAITLLDHIANPLPTMEGLSRYLGSFVPRVPLLVVTLNPGHFERRLATSPSGSLVEQNANSYGALTPAIIESARAYSKHSRAKSPSEKKPDHIADVFFRTLRDWEELFSSGFHILKAAPLQFSDFSILASDDEIATARVSYAVAPFHAWLLYPKNPGAEIEVKQLESFISSPAGFFSKINSSEKSRIRTILKKARAKIKVISYGVGETIHFAHNLGGEASFIIDGTAHLVAENDTHPQTFCPGDIVGELENEWSPSRSHSGPEDKTQKYMIRRYVYPVTAGPAGAKLLVIPADLFAEIADAAGRASFAGELFRNLRDKLLINVWNFFGERMDEERVLAEWNPIKNALLKNTGDVEGWKSARIQRLAKAIMFVASVEASDQNRPTDGSTIFCGPSELKMLLGDDRLSFIELGLELFDRVGLIRWYAKPLWKMSHREQAGVFKTALTRQRNVSATEIGSRIEDIWTEWKQLAFEYLVVSPLAKKLGRKDVDPRIYQRAECGFLAKNQGFDVSKDGFHLTKAGQEEFAHCMGLLKAHKLLDKETQPLVSNWLANIGYANERIVRGSGTSRSQSSRVIRILAHHELRQLAFNENEVTRILADRIAAFPNRTRETLQSLRSARYIETIRDFLGSCWKVGGGCYMSGPNLERSKGLADFGSAVNKHFA